MTPETLIENFEVLAESPEGTQRLRELVLRLAVKGTLSDQDQSDEPASVILDAVAARRAELLKNKTVRRKKAVPDVDDSETPYELPCGWAWTRLDNICTYQLTDGDWVESKDQDPNGEIRLTQLADVGEGRFKDKSSRFLNAAAAERLKCTFLEPHDVLIARLPAPIGRACVFPGLDRPAVTAVDVAIARLEGLVLPQYVVLAMNSSILRDQVIAYGKGVTRFRVATGHLRQLLFPLPPLAEQHRIVAKVDELLALIDQLRVALEEREATRKALRASSLHHLDHAGTSATRKAAWRFFTDIWPEALLSPDDLASLGRSTSRLCVLGLLGSHEVSKETGSFLIDAARSSRQATWEADQIGKMKAKGKTPRSESWKNKYKPLQPCDTDGLPQLPPGWAWAALEEICVAIVDCPHSTPKWTETGEICVRTSDFKPGRLNLDTSRRVSMSTYRERTKRLVPEPGDVLFSREGGILGIACLVPPDTRLCLGQRMMLMRPHPGISSEWIMEVLNSAFIGEIVTDLTTGSAAPHLNVGSVRRFPVPVPPRGTQEAILSQLRTLGELESRASEALEDLARTAADYSAAALDAIQNRD